MGSFSIWHFLVLALVVAVPLYLIPAIMAFVRHHHNRFAILLLNALLGWTFLGWVAALVWAATYAERQTDR